MRCGKGFAYKLPDGSFVKDKARKARIRALGIPPAYCDVWICLNPEGHLQATGLDDRGRKQYRYHPDWTKHRDMQKFDALAEFGRALPKMRRRFEHDLEGEPGSFEFTAAALAMLLDHAPMRIGNPVYANENGSFGATTLRRGHVKFRKDGAIFKFPGKSGKTARWSVSRKKLNRALEEVCELPGKTLFSWVCASGDGHSLGSSDFNKYLAKVSGIANVSSKVFRTWSGTLAAFEIAESALCAGEKPSIKAMAAAAAARLSNTLPVARKSYIHPAVTALAKDIDAVAPGKMPGKTKDRATPHIAGLRADEARLVSFLEARAAR